MADSDRVRRNVSRMQAQGAPQEDIQGYLASEGITDLGQLNAAPIDTTTGAPYDVRKYVGTAPDADRDATMRQFYPDAKPVGDQNFIFTNKDGQRQLYNPKGLDTGDVYSAGREIAEGLGATGGAIGGFFAGGPPGSVLGAGAGAATAQELYRRSLSQGRDPSSPGTIDTRNAKEVLGDAAWSAAFAGGGEMAGYAIGSAARGIGRGLFRGGRKGGKDMAARLGILEAVGATPTVGQASQSIVARTAELLLGNFPGSSGRIAKVAHDSQAAIGERVGAIADDIPFGGRTISQSEAGSGVQKGIGGFVDRFKATAAIKYAHAEKLIPKNTPVDLANTMAALREVAGPISGAEATSNIISSPFLRKAMESLSKDASRNGTIPYRALSQLRTRIGSRLADTSLVQDAGRGELKRVYGGLTTDLLNAAQRAGPKAELAVTEANAYYAKNIRLIDDMLSRISNKTTPELVFKSLETSAREGPTLLRATRQALNKDEWAIFQGMTIRRLGRSIASLQDDVGEQFSTETFLTNWNKLAPDAKDELFGTKTISSLRRDLDQVASASNIIREAGKTYRNPSGTADRIVAQGLLFAGVTGAVLGKPTFLMGLGMAAVGANGAARLMTNRRFVHWLATGTKLKDGNFAPHLGRLAGIAIEADPDTRQAVVDFISAFGGLGSTQQSPNSVGQNQPAEAIQ